MNESVNKKFSSLKLNEQENNYLLQVLKGFYQIPRLFKENLHKFLLSDEFSRRISLDVGIDSYYIHGQNFSYFPDNCGFCFGGVEVLQPEHARQMYLDAPYFMSLSLCDVFTEKNFPAVLSVITFDLDLESKVLYIYQIQGSDTRQYDKLYENDVPQDIRRALNLARRARMRFKDGKPEKPMYLAIENFARSINFSAVAILKPKFNKWPKVARKSGDTLYDYIAKACGFVDDPIDTNRAQEHKHKFYWKHLNNISKQGV